MRLLKHRNMQGSARSVVRLLQAWLPTALPGPCTAQREAHNRAFLRSSNSGCGCIELTTPVVQELVYTKSFVIPAPQWRGVQVVRTKICALIEQVDTSRKPNCNRQVQRGATPQKCLRYNQQRAQADTTLTRAKKCCMWPAARRAGTPAQLSTLASTSQGPSHAWLDGSCHARLDGSCHARCWPAPQPNCLSIHLDGPSYAHTGSNKRPFNDQITSK